MFDNIIAIASIYMVAIVQGAESVISFLVKGWTFNALDAAVLTICLAGVAAGFIFDELKRPKA